VRLGLALAAVFMSFAPGSAQADEATGTWTGSIEGRGNYYYERSTRVIVPSAKVKLSAPYGLRFGVDYLVDVISSASIAQTGSEEDAVQTELRQGAGAEIGKEFDFGNSQLDLGVHGTYSAEDDYKSLIYGLRSILTFNDKNTKLRLSATRVQDEIRSNADPMFDEDLSGMTLATGLEQVLNPVLVLGFGYQFGYLEGFLGNPYRNALIGPLPFREDHPDERFRHTGSARLAFFIPATDTAVHLLYSAYADDWDIAALNPELRIYQQLGPDVILRPRYRFYTQTKAWFQRTYPVGWDGPITNDPKMTAFQTHTLGLSFEHRLSWLSGSFLDFARNTWLDVAFDRYWSTSSFGNGVIATAGGRLEF
jgi:hypothetical protein